MKYFQTIISGFLLLLIGGVIVYDSGYHFSRELVQKKWARRSPQGNWNIWYNSTYVDHNSPFRYQTDLVEMEKRIEPGYSVWSDLVTSYYLAAMLPVYVGNIHRHHGSRLLWGVKEMQDKQSICYLEDTLHSQNVSRFFREGALMSQKNAWPEFRYIVLNKDKANYLLRQECMSVLSRHLELNLLDISQLLYEGQYLNLYELNSFFEKTLRQNTQWPTSVVFDLLFLKNK